MNRFICPDGTQLSKECICKCVQKDEYVIFHMNRDNHLGKDEFSIEEDNLLAIGFNSKKEAADFVVKFNEDHEIKDQVEIAQDIRKEMKKGTGRPEATAIAIAKLKHRKTLIGEK